jgi:hypothetical protein
MRTCGLSFFRSPAASKFVELTTVMSQKSSEIFSGAAPLCCMRDIKRVLSGVPSGGEFAANKKSESEVNLDDTSYSRVRAAETNADVAVDHFVRGHVAEHFLFDGVQPGKITLTTVDGRNEFQRVTSIAGTVLYDRESAIYRLPAEWCRGYKKLHSNYVILPLGHSPADDLPLLDAAILRAGGDCHEVERLQTERDATIMAGFTECVRERHPDAATVLLSWHGRYMVERVLDADNRALWNWENEALKGRGEDATKRKAEYAMWVSRLPDSASSAGNEHSMGYTIVPLPSQTI